MEDILNQVILGNTVENWLIAAGIIIFWILLITLLKRSVLTRLKSLFERTQNNIDNFILEKIEEYVVPAIYFLIIYWGIRTLDLSAQIRSILDVAFLVIITYFVIRVISSVFLMILGSYVLKQADGAEKVRQLGGNMLIINVAIWTVGLLFLLDNLGYNITAIITDLGIGGIAIALAAQNMLDDLSNYFVIFFDRPFEIGDYLVIDDKAGKVDYIGINITRVRAHTGAKLVITKCA